MTSPRSRSSRPRGLLGRSGRPGCRALGLGLALGLVLAACGGSDDDASPSTTAEQTTTTAEETTTTEAETTTTSAPSAAALEVRVDGIGPADLGAEPDQAVAAVEAELGAPSRDTGWSDAAGSDYGFCPGDQARGVEWDDLTLLFTDGATPYGDDGTQHLFGYRLEGAVPEAATAEGLAIGASSAEVRALYGDAATSVSGDELVDPRFDLDLGGAEPLRAVLDDGGNVMAFHAGTPCGE